MTPLKSLKLLHIISSVDPKEGGPVEGIRQRGIFLRNHGHQVEVLSLDDPKAPHVAAYSLPVHAVGPSWRKFAYNKNIQPSLKANARNYDHIINHGLWQYHGHAASKTLRKMGIPYNVFTHGMLDPWFKHTYPIKHLKKWPYWLTAEYHVLRNARHVYFTSEDERIRARESFWLYRANEQVVPYGTTAPPEDKQKFSELFYKNYPHLRGSHLFLYLSRIHPKKGCDLLIEAFSKIATANKNIHLLMAGPAEDSILYQLKEQAKQLGITHHITWLGMLKGEEKWSAFHAANVFILPSHQENFGIAVAEALGSGLPVLISDKINIWREIESDGAGFVAADTTEGTIKNINKWLALSPTEQQTMSDKALACFRKRYTIDAMANGLISALTNN